MIIDNNLSLISHGKFDLKNSKSQTVVNESNVSSEGLPGKPDLKEVAAEAMTKAPNMGEFKDKQGLEQATDLHIGPDIRYALTSKNIQFLKRILWGPLTVGEYREVQYRIKELQSTYSSNQNILSGQLLDVC